MPVDWHYRYQQQARWTSQLRHYLYSKVKSCENRRLLEVGCGTGAILSDPYLENYQTRFGLDINPGSLTQAAQTVKTSQYCLGDGLSLPFPNTCFDLTICHFYLLWVKNPRLALKEMARVTRDGGFVLAMAEPDYGGRIDYPDSFRWLGQLQIAALRNQGADPEIGRRLAQLFMASGLKCVETGVIGGQWYCTQDLGSVDNEWTVLREDLFGLLPETVLKQYENLDLLAWKNRERILFIPTFYAMGQV